MNLKRRQALTALCAELETLRLQYRESLQHFSLRGNGQLREWTRTLAGNGAAGAVLPSAKLAQVLRRRIHRLKLKPHKGRLKDLVAMHEVLKAIARHFPPER